MEELLLNFAVIDVQGMNLYLRHQANTSPDYQSVAPPQSATAPIIEPQYSKVVQFIRNEVVNRKPAM